MKGLVALLLAIIAEIIGTSALKASDGFTRLLPGTLVVIGYVSAFYFLSTALKHIPLGVAYAVWSGVGTVGIVLIGYWMWKETINTTQIIGIGLIICGVVLLNMTAHHPSPA